MAENPPNPPNPLLEALPPKSDYVTYLTVLEFNLTPDQLPTLHQILQDTTLTTNIGWDLVHLLLPLLPASRQCLQDVARLGNPREVVLKVTELIENLGIDAARDLDASDEEFEESKAFDKEKGISPSKELQLITLLEMLSVLHSRIKTKRPSRFLATALRAVLPAYMFMPSDSNMMEAVLGFVRACSGGTRPILPPRKSVETAPPSGRALIAPDPEEDEDAALATKEVIIHNRLLLVFLMGIFSHYMLSLKSSSDIPGLAWCSRQQEKSQPKKHIPGRRTFSIMFAEDEKLQERDIIIGQMVALARDLKIDPNELLSVITNPKADHEEEERFPLEVDQVPLHHSGSLFILSALLAASSLLDVPTSLPELQIFPTFAVIVSNFIGASSLSEIGSENEAVVDAVLFLGFFILRDSSDIDLPAHSEDFNTVLQRLSILSAECPSPNLRYHAHVLTSAILHAHPMEKVRLDFIYDTLEHCPYENLKGSAIGWLKDEILSADSKVKSPKSSSSVFLSPRTIAKLAPVLFPNPRKLSPVGVEHEHFIAYSSFYLAALNLYYLFLSSASLYLTLDIKTMSHQLDVRGNLLLPLRDMGREISSGMLNQSDIRESLADDVGVLTEIKLLETTIQMVEQALKNKGL